MLKGKKCFVFGKKCIKAGFIAGVRRDGCTAGPGKNGVRKEILQGLAAFPANHIGGKQCHAPWTALSCGLHNGYRCVHSSGENPLTNARRFEKSSVPKDSINPHVLGVKNIIAHFQRSQR